MKIKRALKIAGVLAVLGLCLGADNPPDPTGDRCREYCQGVVSGGVDELERCIAACRENNGPPSCTTKAF